MADDGTGGVGNQVVWGCCVSANNRLRFVTKALYCMIAEDCTLEGVELQGLFEILEDVSLQRVEVTGVSCMKLDTIKMGERDVFK